jgi:hypothetical protein
METLVREQPIRRMRPLRHTGFPNPAYPTGHPGDECPACHGKHMRWIANEMHAYNYLCDTCGRCWMMGPVGAVRVNPVTCRACDRHDVCLEELRHELVDCPWLPSR